MAMNEAIAKAVAEATRVTIQTLSEVQSQRPEDQRGPKLGGPVLKQHNSIGKQQTNTQNGKHLYLR